MTKFQEKDKRTYNLWFWGLILPNLLIRIFQIRIHPDDAMLLTVVAKLAIIIVTIWYALKIGFNVIKAVLLGFAAGTVPFMAWISYFILIAYTPDSEGDERESSSAQKEGE